MANRSTVAFALLGLAPALTGCGLLGRRARGVAIQPTVDLDVISENTAHPHTRAIYQETVEKILEVKATPPDGRVAVRTAVLAP